MKHTFTLLLAFFALQLFGQNCTNPVSEATFQANFTQIAVQHTDAAKLASATMFVNNNCVTSSQVKTIALLFAADSVRLQFCKAAYTHTSDVANFFNVYDAFSSFSSALRLYDYVNKSQAPNVIVATQNPPPPMIKDPVFPNWIYPDTARTTKNKGCSGPVMSETGFKSVARNVNQQPTDESKLVAIETAYTNNCLSMAQLMKLASLISNEDLRFRSMKAAFPRIYDQEHYTAAVVALSNGTNQAAWNTYCKNLLTPPPPPCVTDAEFQPLLQQIKDKPFTDDKMNLVTLLSKDRCFKTSQIKAISKEFAFGEEKLKVFKMLYVKCPDQNNYYQLVDELTFQSEKDDLSSFIRNGGK